MPIGCATNLKPEPLIQRTRSVIAPEYLELNRLLQESGAGYLSLDQRTANPTPLEFRKDPDHRQKQMLRTVVHTDTSDRATSDLQNLELLGNPSLSLVSAV